VFFAVAFATGADGHFGKYDAADDPQARQAGFSDALRTKSSIRLRILHLRLFRSPHAGVATVALPPQMPILERTQVVVDTLPMKCYYDLVLWSSNQIISMVALFGTTVTDDLMPILRCMQRTGMYLCWRHRLPGTCKLIKGLWRGMCSTHVSRGHGQNARNPRSRARSLSHIVIAFMTLNVPRLGMVVCPKTYTVFPHSGGRGMNLGFRSSDS
jgi:hypothetical protein